MIDEVPNAILVTFMNSSSSITKHFLKTI
jgi:hypothetical protein